MVPGAMVAGAMVAGAMVAGSMAAGAMVGGGGAGGAGGAARILSKSQPWQVVTMLRKDMIHPTHIRHKFLCSVGVQPIPRIKKSIENQNSLYITSDRDDSETC